MHNIRTNFSKFYGICKDLFKNETGYKTNFQVYPVRPKMNDLEIVSLACCMEALSIDSENLLWSKLKKDYASYFPNLIDRSRFNRRRKRLAPFIIEVQEHISSKLANQSQAMIVDSIPVPVVKMAREKRFKSFQNHMKRLRPKGGVLLTKAGLLVTNYMS
ncbi:MAG: hypothetical protein IPJ81_13820 [Chitinophagaceae bacterium]|nr:hypothetical protein [Chitinophagaceae bacterium]